MYKSKEPNAINGAAKPAEQAKMWGPSRGNAAPPFTTVESGPNPKETAQEAVHEITPKSAVTEPGRPMPIHLKPVDPPRAAQGDDDLMSKQQQQSMPSADEVKGKWKQQVGAAKIAWGKLTDDEILQSEGHIQKLAGLVQERYAVTRDEAEKQVMRFFDKQAAPT